MISQALRRRFQSPPPPPPLPSPASGGGRGRGIGGRDREFLPAALEILETPPAPLPVVLMLTLCAFTAIALGWSFFGRLDVHAVTQGKIEPNGRSKVIQPLDPGKVQSLAVENGSRVKAGDLLIGFEPSEAEADVRAYAGDVMNARAEIVRRRAAIEATDKWPGQSLLPAPALAFDTGTGAEAAAREKSVLAADLGQLADVLTNLEKQIAQKTATRERLNMSIAFQSTLIETLQQRVGMRQETVRKGAGSLANLYDALESLDKSRSALAGDQGQLIETEAAITALLSEKTKAISQFVADNANKLADAERKADNSVQQLAKATTRLARTKLLAPIDGTVQTLAVTTIGQVVTTGQQLMILVPNDGELSVEVYVSNADIGFVKPGQEAAIKVDAFPFTRYGTLRGKVIRIATDAIDEQDARRAQANAANLANSSNSGSSGVPGQPQSFVFPVTLSLEERAMKVGEAVIPFTPGMTVTAEIKTESRRVIDYLFSPLAKVASEALHEK
jgi:hemolysin D